MNTIYLILAILPLTYKILFWLYIVQLKEYRYDRLKDYIKTPQWKKAIFNFLTILEILFLLLIVVYAFFPFNEDILKFSLLTLLIIENTYIMFKFIGLRFFYPKFTKRMIILASLSFLTIFALLAIIYLKPKFLYLSLIKLILFSPIVVLCWNSLTDIFFKKAKEKIFKAAENKMKQLNIYTVAITWSYWKSSTKEFLAKILEDDFNVIKTPKNINTEIWVSNFILNQLESKLTNTNKKSIFIAEAWAYSKWEISRMWKILQHKDGFLTGLWNQHISLFWSQQNLVDGKFEIWEQVLKNNWKLYLNNSNLKIDKENLKIWFPINQQVKTPKIYNDLKEKNQIITYPNDFKITNITENSTEFIWNNQKFKTNVVGVWLIENLIWAIKFALDKWVSIETIKEKIQEIDLPEHTMKIYEKTVTWPNNYKILYIDDSYNLSTNSVINAVNTVKDLKWKKLLILDDILELWKYANQIHKNLWEYVADKVDEVLFIGVNYKNAFIKWLKNKNFKWKILDNFPHITENYIVILEWRRTQKFLPR